MPRVLPVLSIALGLSTAGCLIYAWQLHGRLAQAEAEIALREKDLAALQAQTGAQARDTVPINDLESDSPLAVTAPGEPAGSVPSAARPVPRNEAGSAWRNTPEAQRLMALQRRAGLDNRYAALFRKLNLSPTDLEKFKALLVDKQSAAMDVMNTAREQGLNPRENRDQIRQLIEGLEAETDAAIQAALGEAAYQQYRQYEQTIPQRNMVNQIEQRLSYSSAPLYGNQTEQLVSLLATSASSGRSVTTPSGPAPGVRGGAITDAIITQSEGFLSQPQVEALRQLQREQAAQAELRQQMQNNRRAGGGGNVTTPPAGPGP